MNADRLVRPIALFAAGAAVTAMALTGCSTKEKEAPSTTTTPSTSQAPSTSESPVAISPTEKAVGPGGNNSFSPTINPTPPGAVCTQIVNGVCVR